MSLNTDKTRLEMLRCNERSAGAFQFSSQSYREPHEATSSHCGVHHNHLMFASSHLYHFSRVCRRVRAAASFFFSISFKKKKKTFHFHESARGCFMNVFAYMNVVNWSKLYNIVHLSTINHLLID